MDLLRAASLGLFHLPRVLLCLHGERYVPRTRGLEISWFTAMFMHGSWDHILGNMLFLAVFGKNVEDALGRLRYLAFYIAGGFVANATQTAITLLAGSAASARVPMLGASGAIAAVLGAYFVLYPDSRVLTLVLVFPVKIPAWIWLGVWFLYQLVEADYGITSAHANGGGVAFFAHVGGIHLWSARRHLACADQGSKPRVDRVHALPRAVAKAQC